MSLMDGGEEQYAQMVETGAIARIVGEIEAAVATLNMTPAAIIQLFTDLWNSFTIDDLIHPLDAFVRIIEKFGEPIGRLIAFVAEIVRIVIVAILEIMNFPFDLIGNIITRAMQAIDDIKKDPIGFLKNILRAIKQGFVQFFDNIVTHLINGVTGWLMSELKDANIPVLTDFSLRGVIAWVLEVLGISMEKIWEKLAAHPRIGPARVARIRSMINTLEGIWTFIKDVQERGMAAIWDKIQEQLSNLWNTVLDAVKNFIMERIVNRITARLLSMLDPTGIMAVINGAIALYSAIQSFIKYLREMLEVVNSFVNGVADIAKGNVATAANYLENTMGQAMPIVIGFLANQVGLSGIGARIGEMIVSVQQMVDEALTWLVNKAVDTGMAMLDRIMGRGEPEAATPAGPIAGALAEIDTESEKEKDEGQITEEEAQAIKNKVNTDQAAVINISSVTDGGENWNFNYIQKSPLVKTVLKGTGTKGKELIGTVAPQEAPEGYYYYDFSNGSFKVKRGPNKISEGYIGLAIEAKEVSGADGDPSGIENVFVEKEEEGGSNRISISGKLATAIGGPKSNHQAHHIIPDAEVRQTKAQNPNLNLGSSGYDLDRGSNGIMVPCNDEGKKAIPSLPLHKGSHPQYNIKVLNYIGQRVALLQQRGTPTSNELLAVMSATEVYFRAKIESNSASSVNSL
ncbi:MAG: AHH domain-containing protein, partial [Flavobacterium sp.]